MRICLFTETALPKVGGQEIVVDALARQFVALGHEPVVLAPRPRHLALDDASLPYPVVRHPRFISTRWFVAWYRWFLERLYRRRPFEVLHCHGLYPPAYLAALSRHKIPVPVVVTSHGGDVYEHNTRLARAVLKQRHVQAATAADAFIAISRFTRDGICRLCPEPPRIVDIPNGVDLRPFAMRAERPARLAPEIRPGEYALFLGRLKHRKGVDVLLQALAATAHGQLIIVGDGQERPALETLSERLGLRNRVRFVGEQLASAKVYLLQNALFAVVPSRSWEAFGLVVVESYAAGLPVIGTRMPGLRDLIQPERTGLLVAPEAPGELAAAMQRLFGDLPLARRMGEHAREVARGFDWRIIAERHLALYRELAAARCRRIAA